MPEQQIALDQPEVPVLAVPESRDREVVSLSPYKPYVLSKGEKLVCEVWARTRSYKACIEALRAKYNRKITKRGIEKWMRYREAVQSYILKLEGWEVGKMSELEWEGRVGELARSDVKLNKTTPMMYKLYAEKMGWMKEKEKNSFVGKQINVQILQSDGRA